MVRVSDTRLACWVVRKSLDSKRLYSSLNHLSDTLPQASRRGFISSSCNSCRNFGVRDLENAKFSTWGFQYGVLLGCLGSTRKIHGTGYACRDYYKILGVTKKASASKIKKAYHELAKKHHPDVNKDDADATKNFQELQKAYEVLKDNEQRSLYDQVGRDAYENGAAPDDVNPSDEDSGGGGLNYDFYWEFSRTNGSGGLDARVTMELSFMEAIWGCSKALTFETSFTCEPCGGTGVPPGTRPEKCQTCGGSGKKYSFWTESTCKSCRGTGKTARSLCKSCKGFRVVKGWKTVNIDVMPGIDIEKTIRIPKSGGADPDPDGKKPGHLYVRIDVREDPVFRREGLDIHVDVVLCATQAILGGTIQVPTIHGDVDFKVCPGTDHGDLALMKGKGIKTTSKNSESAGDQYVHFKVSIPKKLTQRERELLEEFVKERRGDYKNDTDRAAFG